MSENDIQSAPLEGQELEAEFKRLTALSDIEYDRTRKESAKSLGLRVDTLDEQVRQRRGDADDDQQDDAVVEELEAWPDRVEGDVLDEIRADFERHVIADSEALDAVAAWTLGTFCYDCFPVWSKLFFSSPERRCGKTVALEVLEANASRALMASNITPSAIFRAVHEWRPSLILDEVDTFSPDNEELNGIINAGHRKRTAVVIRTAKVGDDHLPRKFSVWSPMAIAAIGRLKDTIMDRSIAVSMRRKMPGERSQKVPPDLFERNKDRRRRCLRWAEDNAETLRSAHVETPPHGNDRAVDNWHPLFVIAQTIGGDWPERIETAFGKLSAEEDEESIGPMLLSDIREVFEGKGTPKLFSQDLVDALVEMEDRPWSEWRRGKAMTQNSVAKLLKPFRVKPRQLRIGSFSRKGYELAWFRDAFERYLSTTPSLEPPKQTETPKHPSNGAGSGEIQNETNLKDVSVANPRQPSNGAGCFGVSVENGASTEEGEVDSVLRVLWRPRPAAGKRNNVAGWSSAELRVVSLDAAERLLTDNHGPVEVRLAGGDNIPSRGAR